MRNHMSQCLIQELNDTGPGEILCKPNNGDAFADINLLTNSL